MSAYNNKANRGRGYLDRFTPINSYDLQQPTTRATSEGHDSGIEIVSDSEDNDSEHSTTVSHDTVVQKAAALVRTNPKSLEKTPISERHYLRGPKTRPQISTKPTVRPSALTTSAATCVSAGPESSSTMPTATTANRQKLLAQYPSPSTPLPSNWTLVELCYKYPNHLIGSNLISFLQHGWTASIILDFVQAANPECDLPFSNSLMTARLRETRLRLGPALMKVLHEKPKHEEGC